MKKILALALILTFILPPTLVSANRTRGVFLSGMRIDFDGVDERGKTGNDPTGNTNTSGTVSCWVRFDTVLAANGVAWVFQMGGDDTDLSVGSVGNFGMLLRRNSVTGITNRMEIIHRVDAAATANNINGDTTISAATQYHFVASSSGTAYKLYVNGDPETLTVTTGSDNGNWKGDIGSVGTRHYALGDAWRDGTWAGNLINGQIDHCATWSSQLTDAQVLSLYNGGKPTHPCLVECTTLENFWKLGEDANGTVTTMHDAIGSATVDNFTMENMENADIVTTSYY